MWRKPLVGFIWTICLSALLQCSSVAGGVCPMGCFCSEKIVDCSALMEFPMDLLPDTTVFKVSHLNVIEIPAYAFSYLENITKVEFINCNIASLAAFAFNSLSSIKEIIFDKTVIRNIESYSLMNLENITKIQFSNSRISRIKPFAFYQMSNISEFSFFNTHIRHFYSHGFYECSSFDSLTIQSSNVSDFITGAFTDVVDIKMFTVDDTSFWNMHCGVIDDMQATTEDFYFTKNTFYCNCSISWMLSDEGASRYAYLRGISGCHGPDDMMDKTAISDVDFAQLGCKGIQPSTKVKCKREKLKPRPNAVTRGGVINDNGDGTGPEGGANSVRIGVFHVFCILGLYFTY